MLKGNVQTSMVKKSAATISFLRISGPCDVGAVALNLAGAAEVRDAFLRIRDSVRAQFLTADIVGVVVQRMAPEGIEIIAG